MTSAGKIFLYINKKTSIIIHKDMQINKTRSEEPHHNKKQSTPWKKSHLDAFQAVLLFQLLLQSLAKHWP